MIIRLDLHSHSGYAGGVGKVPLDKIAAAMVFKGLDVFGTGDCLYPPRVAELKGLLVEKEPGLFALTGAETAPLHKTHRFILQTEVIFTYAGSLGGRKLVHLVILLPSFGAVEQTINLLDKWGVKNTVGRPFIVCSDSKDVSDRLLALTEIDSLIEIIPAHVMTPQGIFGSRNQITSLVEAFGEATSLIHAVETGISADPAVLDLIPELDDLTLVSNSDCHSAQLHRIGREFTAVEVEEFSYSAIIKAIRENKVTFTAEFNPREGRFFLTGHRGDKQGHQGEGCFFTPQETPEDMRCPVCGKVLTGGVFARAAELGKLQGNVRQFGVGPRSSNGKHIYMVPLGEIIAASFGVKNPVSKRVLESYFRVVEILGSEADLWMSSVDEVLSALQGLVRDEVLQAVLQVKKGDFIFDPAGFDGTYGKLVLL